LHRRSFVDMRIAATQPGDPIGVPESTAGAFVKSQVNLS